MTGVKTICKIQQQKIIFDFGIFLPFLLAKNSQNYKNEKKHQIYNITIEVVFFYLINLDYLLKIQKQKIA